jgi:serine/threonine-protein kinase
LPFDGETAADIFRRHVWTPAPALQLYGEDLDLTFAHAVERCLDKNPDRRFQNGDDLADALAQAPEIRGRELPVPLEAFVDRLRRFSASTRGLSLFVGAALIVLADGVIRGEWIRAAWAAGLVGVAAVGASLALLPTMRRVLRAGFTRAQVVHALSVDLERDRRLRRFRHGNQSPTPALVSRWIAYGGLGLLGLGAASSLVPFIPPEVGLLAIVYGAVVALGSSLVGALLARRLNRSRRLWLKFWNSRAGEWAARLAGAGLPRESTGGPVPRIAGTSAASDEPYLDEPAARRINQWVDGAD